MTGFVPAQGVHRNRVGFEIGASLRRGIHEPPPVGNLFRTSRVAGYPQNGKCGIG